MPDPAIVIEGLTKDYPVGFLLAKKRRSLENLTMEVHAGEVFGFLGPNGAGKSTTIKLLMGLIFPTAGTARISRNPNAYDWMKVMAANIAGEGRSRGTSMFLWRQLYESTKAPTGPSRLLSPACPGRLALQSFTPLRNQPAH